MQTFWFFFQNKNKKKYLIGAKKNGSWLEEYKD
jgi:hypothetical protein